MTDRELFQKAVKSLPSLGPPLLGTLLVGWLGGEVLPQAIFTMIFGQVERIEEWFGLLLAFLAVWALLACMKALLQLGTFRFCLDRGEGKERSMPWTILSQWWRYIGWVVWTTVLFIFLSLGGWMLVSLAADRLDYRQIEGFFTGKAYVGGALTLLSPLVTALLLLSIRTAYLRAPERGFWRAVSFGLREGLRKWPKTIGAQVKFVVPVHVGMILARVLLSKAVLQAGGEGNALLYRGMTQLLSLLGSVWITVFYGHLAATRYDPPNQGVGEASEEREKSAAARFTEGLIGKPSPLFPSRRNMKLIRGGPWYYRDSRKGPMIPGPLERK